MEIWKIPHSNATSVLLCFVMNVIAMSGMTL